MPDNRSGYTVKEIFYTLQGEGAHSGRAAVFCRLTGCNLWTGLEKDRANAVCRFCDTDFVGTDGENGGVFETAVALAAGAGAGLVYRAGIVLVAGVFDGHRATTCPNLPRAARA
jgi:hypothetical protein